MREALLEELRQRGRGASLDTLELLIDHAWFPTTVDPRRSVCAQEVSLVDHFGRWADELLEHQGNVVTLRSQDSERFADRIQRWRWVSLALPADLLVGFACRKQREAVIDDVHLLTPGLERILAGPVAETHVHRSAIWRFAAFWTTLMSLDVDSSNDTHVRGFVPFGSVSSMRERLDQASVARWAMSRFLSQRETSKDFRTFLEQDMLAVARDIVCLEDALRFHWSLIGVLGDLVGGLSKRRHWWSANEICLQLRQHAQTFELKQGAANHIRVMDPIRHHFSHVEEEALPETLWVHQGIRYLSEDHGRKDAAFAHLFWQYQRVRCQVFSWLVEAPGTAGLSWFSEHFERIGILEPPSAVSRSSLEPFVHESRGLNLRGLEVRVTPKLSAFDAAASLASAATTFGQHAAYQNPVNGQRAAQNEEIRRETVSGGIELGVVMHFTKTTAKARPGANKIHHARYSDWYLGALADAMDVRDRLLREPAWLVLLRGLDVAGRELAAPTWAILPLIKVIRDASIEAADHLRRCSRQPVVPPMRVTAHTGEDFRTLHEGLRRISEILVPGGLREGDRIGHGLAVGLDPVRWGNAHRDLVQPRLERIVDLLWELDLYETGHVSTDGARILQTQRRLRDLIAPLRLRERFGCEDEGLSYLRRIRESLLDGSALRRLSYPSVPVERPQENTVEQRFLAFLYDYFTDDTLYALGEEPVEIAIDAAEIQFLASAQRYLRSELGRMEITIETNPSSNLIIHDFSSIEEHPSLRLQPIHYVPGGDATVAVSINDDDPLTFATRLADEYAYIYSALIGMGMRANDALSWLDRVRESGWRSRFTIPASADPNILRALLAQ